MTIRHNTGLIENFRIAVEQKKTLETIPEVLSILILEYHALQSRRNTDFSFTFMFQFLVHLISSGHNLWRLKYRTGISRDLRKVLKLFSKIGLTITPKRAGRIKMYIINIIKSKNNSFAIQHICLIFYKSSINYKFQFEVFNSSTKQ